MVEKQVTVLNQNGIHARPSAMIVEESSKFSSSITLVNNGAESNAKSIMGILTLSAVCGTEIIVRCEGEDEQAALDTIAGLFIDRFGQED